MKAKKKKAKKTKSVTTKAVTITLTYPITFGSQHITELTIRPLKGKDMRRLKTSQDRPMAIIMELAAYLSGQVREVIDELEGEDLQTVMQVVSGFLGSGLGTGTEE